MFNVVIFVALLLFSTSRLQEDEGYEIVLFSLYDHS